MLDKDIGRADRFPAATGEAPSEIRILAIHKERFVEEPGVSNDIL